MQYDNRTQSRSKQRSKSQTKSPQLAIQHRQQTPEPNRKKEQAIKSEQHGQALSQLNYFRSLRSALDQLYIGMISIAQNNEFSQLSSIDFKGSGCVLCGCQCQNTALYNFEAYPIDLTHLTQYHQCIKCRQTIIVPQNSKRRTCDICKAQKQITAITDSVNLILRIRTSKVNRRGSNEQSFDIRLGDTKIPLDLKYRRHYYRLAFSSNQRIEQELPRFEDAAETVEINDNVADTIGKLRQSLENFNEFYSIKPEKDDFLSNFLRRFQEISGRGAQFKVVAEDLLDKHLNSPMASRYIFEIQENCEQVFRTYLKFMLQLQQDLAAILPLHALALDIIIKSIILLFDQTLTAVSERLTFVEKQLDNLKESKSNNFQD